jgi:23S rRNA pseudouridine955/2504/2580 synthase
MHSTNSKPTVQTFKADENNTGQRIDNFLIKILKGVPKTHIYRILRKGEVRINKKRIKPDYRLQFGDQIRVPPIKMTQKIDHKPSASTIKLLEHRIVYEDDGLLIINKPSGMASHGGSGVNFGVIETIRNMRPKAKFLELAHRLDRDTSGCIIITKKRRVLTELHELLRNNQIVKTYLVLVRGKWQGSVRWVDAPLLKNQLKSGERMVHISDAGKSAKTEFRLHQQFTSAALLEATLHTGRTHQIRVHAAHIGYPIAGDEKYGDKEFNKTMRAIGLKRLFLHAHTLKFKLPEAIEPINLKVALDADLLKILENLVK